MGTSVGKLVAIAERTIRIGDQISLPEKGVYGGRLQAVKACYEDGTDAAIGIARYKALREAIIHLRRVASVGMSPRDLMDRLSAAKSAISAVLPEMHGDAGGPLCTISGVYSDGTDEDSARHRGSVSPEDVRKAKRVVLDISKQVPA